MNGHSIALLFLRKNEISGNMSCFFFLLALIFSLKKQSPFDHSAGIFLFSCLPERVIMLIFWGEEVCTEVKVDWVWPDLCKLMGETLWCSVSTGNFCILNVFT